MTLEELRYDDLGRIAVGIQNQTTKQGFFFTVNYQDYCISAYRSTMQELGLYENALFQVHASPGISTVVNAWFLCIESFISSILKILSITHSTNFAKAVRKELGSRMDQIIRLAGYDHESINRTGIRKELQEFISFRNEILHDRQFEKPFEIAWTSFSKYPPYLNILDVMQAMFIAQDTLQLFRKILPSNDIMPHVPITTTEAATFVKLDTVVRELIIPIFEQINRKHGLSSNIKYPHWPTPLGHGRGFSEYRIFFAIKAEPKVVYKGNSLVTGICQENETRFITNLGLKPGTITVPNYLDT